MMKQKYKRMLKGMQEKEGKRPRRRRKNAKDRAWHLYILRCQDQSLYTGITTDIDRRFALHNAGRAARYTRTRRPVRLLYRETCGTRTQAMVRECEVKSMTKKKKETFLASGGVRREAKRKGRKSEARRKKREAR